MTTEKEDVLVQYTFTFNPGETGLTHLSILDKLVADIFKERNFELIKVNAPGFGAGRLFRIKPIDELDILVETERVRKANILNQRNKTRQEIKTQAMKAWPSGGRATRTTPRPGRGRLREKQSQGDYSRLIKRIAGGR